MSKRYAAQQAFKIIGNENSEMKREGREGERKPMRTGMKREGHNPGEGR
jgi:hypothetical protein